MPLHDWTRVPSGLYHDFHQSWSVRIKDALNRTLPKGLSAFVEQKANGRREPDVLTIDATDIDPETVIAGEGGVATLSPPRASIVRRSDSERFAARANRIVVRHGLGRVIAAIEIVSPGNKDGRSAFRKFVEKSVDFLANGVHLLIVDPFPPTPRDPCGVHKAIWDEFLEEDFEFPAGKDRILVSYDAGPERVAYIEPIAVGDPLPDMPLFIAEGVHVPVPLERTYDDTWEVTPDVLRTAVETGRLPDLPGEST